MDRDELLKLIDTHGVARMAKAIEGIPGPQLVQGWNLLDWRIAQVPGALLFYPLDGNEVSIGPRILAVKAPEADRVKWQAMVAEERAAGSPDTTLHLYQVP